MIYQRFAINGSERAPLVRAGQLGWPNQRLASRSLVGSLARPIGPPARPAKPKRADEREAQADCALTNSIDQSGGLMKRVATGGRFHLAGRPPGRVRKGQTNELGESHQTTSGHSRALSKLGSRAPTWWRPSSGASWSERRARRLRTRSRPLFSHVRAVGRLVSSWPAVSAKRNERPSESLFALIELAR